jgi:general secretion pathway protein G
MHTTRRRRAGGFTLIEIMVVMAIIAMLAAMVGPRIMGALGKSQRQGAAAQIERLGAALDTYRLDMGRYPTTQEGLGALVQPPANAGRWDGPYLNKNQIPLDPWDNPYQYRSPGGGGRPYDLFTFGADGAPGGEGDSRDITSWEG